MCVPISALAIHIFLYYPTIRLQINKYKFVLTTPIFRFCFDDNNFFLFRLHGMRHNLACIIERPSLYILILPSSVQTGGYGVSVIVSHLISKK